MDVKSFIKDNILVFDGAMGTMLQKKGLKLGECPEGFNIKEKDILREIHEEYIDAGAMVITTNTFGANEIKLEEAGYEVEEIVDSAISIAKEAINGRDVLIAQDIGPIGQLLEPMGTLSFNEAYEIFKRQIIQGVKSGADLFIVETMTDLQETRAAILAVKENSDLPVFCTMSFEENGRTFTGCTPESMVLTLEGLGVDAVGVNCSLGPDELIPIVKRITDVSNIPIMTQPNAGLPVIEFGETTYKLTAAEFKKTLTEFVSFGVSIVGGCCGTTPEFIKGLREIADSTKRVKRKLNNDSAVCTPSKVVKIDSPKVIGERINPTGKKIFQQALIDNNIDYIIGKAIEQVEAGADILDVNVGLPQIDEKAMMINVIGELQAVIDTPLQIDSSNSDVIEAGLRKYAGKAIVNSVNGEDEVLDRILPIVKKYGASVVGLTLDKRGIPKTAEERFKIAEKIVNRAKEYGIDKKNVFIDCLVLTASAEQDKVKETLKAVRMVTEKLGVNTVLGVSNISFGLPCRDLINETFFSLALANGLTLPIMNPNKQGMMNVINAYNVLYNIDKGSNKFISMYAGAEVNGPSITLAQKKDDSSSEEKSDDIKYIVVKGLKDQAAPATRKLLESLDELEVVNNYLIPALDIVGAKYEKGEIFLPQLIQAAETVKKAFDVIKENLVKSSSENISKGKIVIATVKGDIHDIGKNIVKVILENYGYEILDLGKDVPIEKVVETAINENVKLVGLSALMTTTVKSMEDTIKALHESGYKGEVFVGGAVLTQETADLIKADYYCKDAKESVEVAKKVFG
ncbi:homocysteine S-methyltransferase family protein [Clostridium sp. HCP1S3_B4]|uniref:homocysteine S-methyltransferase family protein n=1 Tax=unclassified Clostridium TaxID=2614128 RepID=UPI00168F6C1E|nr:homocysteine S-methyltransferase family protein [Clostridiales bacterium]MDY2730504.1 homocysteine S-methyltransferase family protein [Clostridium sp.]NLK24531.1 dihydropteroate synthase [Clostridiales bacterium]